MFAIIGLRAWRRQVIGKRKIEVAEETLVLAHKIRNAIAFVRLPVHGPEEGGSRPRQPQDGSFKKIQDSYSVAIERLRAYDEDFAKLEKQRLLCETYFGPQAGKPLETLSDVRRRILIAARGLLSLPLDRQLNEQEMASVARWEAGIQDFGDADDPLTPSIDDAIRRVEEICRPFLK